MNQEFNMMCKKEKALSCSLVMKCKIKVGRTKDQKRENVLKKAKTENDSQPPFQIKISNYQRLIFDKYLESDLLSTINCKQCVCILT